MSSLPVLPFGPFPCCPGLFTRFSGPRSGCRPSFTPEKVLAAPEDALRSAGLSASKLSYIRDLSARFQSGELSEASLAALDDDDDLARRLLAVKGIGPWTVCMFSMFYLRRPDILATGDLAVRKGMAKLYGLKALPTPKECEAIAAPWAPYRTVGTFLMYRACEKLLSKGSSPPAADSEAVAKGAPPASALPSKKRARGRKTAAAADARDGASAAADDGGVAAASEPGPGPAKRAAALARARR